MATPERLPEVEKAFPKLRKPGSYLKTSERDDLYNCVAWAMSDIAEFWDPSGAPGYYWPDGVPRGFDVTSYVRLFEIVGGFSTCTSAKPEVGFEKVAIYGQEGRFLHVARQLESGRWTSKLGREQDIEHKNLETLEGGIYGKVQVLLKRPRRAQSGRSTQRDDDL